MPETAYRTAPGRLDTISKHFSPVHMAEERPFITCHVLDTITGKPGAGVDVQLKLISPEHATTAQWTAQTNGDGRVTAWSPSSPSPSSSPPSSADINRVVHSAKAQLKGNEQLIWSLTFDTEAYYGRGKTFWPQVELRFAAEKDEEHYHVPLLLGPWSYTTYRGS